MRLHGLEHRSAHAETVAALRVRVFRRAVRYERGYGPLPDAMVVLTHRIRNGLDEGLPLRSPFAGMTDDKGAVGAKAAPGVYRVKIVEIGNRTGEGSIQLRESAADSLHANLFESAICS